MIQSNFFRHAWMSIWVRSPTNQRLIAVEHRLFGASLQMMFVLKICLGLRSHTGSNTTPAQCCPSEVLVKIAQSRGLQVVSRNMNLSPTQNSCLFTNGNKASVWETIIVPAKRMRRRSGAVWAAQTGCEASSPRSVSRPGLSTFILRQRPSAHKAFVCSDDAL